ncbi:M3 family metallopeptidase [Truepera radiovictrix]|uniref:oligopeptidase A n=1 Tax=Truepera radiovictrix (strain DSM 17093 / CIP 108686 / LMG 22925 / RQ-24) TaxID=649638 RepID=D7CQW1_TRURR|nr:M3 family metallopeptidase [Truepera radiovictrix]ADI15095.1 Oligopeptidase A [Truepera radiovictrix DSM 17093]WMT56352.1 M3 family metallopeptidase [Truepera radiovictrix]
MNPLLSREPRVPFSAIRPDHVEPALDTALAEAQTALEALVTASGPRTFDTILALDALTERLSRPMGLVAHLVSVQDSPELRAAYNAVLPRYTAFLTGLPLHEGLWRAVKEAAESPQAARLEGVARRHLEKTLQEFRRAGAELSGADKARLEAINVELSQLGAKFSENTLDATNAFELLLTDEADLAGLPASALERARSSAEAKGLSGWRFTLQAPSYVPFMTYAENRALRETMYRAYTSRASGGAFDNREVIGRILALRRERAQLLGYPDHADYALEPRMVGSGARALAFVTELTERTRPHWQREVAELSAFAAALGLGELQPWDVAFVTERLRRERYAFDEEALRPFFPLEGVLAGLFELTETLFGVRVTRRDNPEVWHPDVAYYDLHDLSGTHLGSFYTDWFPREDKRSGAWMNPLITGGPTAGGFDPHVALIAANFSPPEGGRPALLTHSEVQTTFHEFGHLLHHCLSRVSVRARAGTNVAWDFVELPSQIMENWCWERPALDLFARHVDTGERLPEELFNKLRAARTFAGANAQMRQLSYGAVDLALHITYDPASGDPVGFAQRVMAPFAIRPEFAHNSFLTAFTHIFAGGYAAGYYSYKWAEVLDADAFSRFQREGLFNPETGRAFVEAILSRGDSAPPEVLFREFMGRDPDPEALLRRNLGLGETAVRPSDEVTPSEVA